MKLLLVLIIIFHYSKSFSHECVLKDTTSKEITIYNSCLSQQQKNSSSINLNKSLLKQRILELKNENLRLENKLLNLKKKLHDLSKLIENYAKL